MNLKPYFSFISIVFFALIVSFSVLAQTVFSPQKYKDEVDKKVKSSLDKVQYFVKLKGTEKPFRVPHPNYWPRDVEFNYSLFYDGKGNLIYAIKETEPQTSTGGWTLLYAYYFSADDGGKTIAIHKHSTFYNNFCAGNETITLKDISYFDKNNFKRIERNYALTSETGRQLDSLQCEPPYHFPYKSYAPTREAFLKESGFVK